MALVISVPDVDNHMGKRVSKSPKCTGISQFLVVTLCYVGHITVIALRPSLQFIGPFPQLCSDCSDIFTYKLCNKSHLSANFECSQCREALSQKVILFVTERVTTTVTHLHYMHIYDLDVKNIAL